MHPLFAGKNEKSQETTQLQEYQGVVHDYSITDDFTRKSLADGKEREHPSKNTENTEFFTSGDAESGAHSNSGVIDPDLAEVISHWPALSDAIKANILKLVR